MQYYIFPFLVKSFICFKYCLLFSHVNNTSSDKITFFIELQNSTIEERVTILEFQVDNINNDINTINDEIIATNNDVTTLNNDVETLETEVRDLDEDLESQITVISAEQVLQDERLFTLEENEEGKSMHICHDILCQWKVVFFSCSVIS